MTKANFLAFWNQNPLSTLSQPLLPSASINGLHHFKSEDVAPLYPLPRIKYQNLTTVTCPAKLKTEIKEESSKAQKDDEEILKAVFKIQQSQIQSTVSSQQQLATAVSLPQPEVPKFTGNPMRYKTFIMAFNARIQSSVTSNADRLYYLDQHPLEESKDLISGCLDIEPDEGYVETRKLLEKEYGDPYKIPNAFMQKLYNWLIIKYDDGPGLKRFSFFLIKCKNAMKTICYVAVLNHPPNM